MTVIKAAAVQLSPVLYSREGTADKVCRQILALGRQGVQFATFPETVVPYYPYFSFVQRPFQMGTKHLRLMEQAVTVPSDATRAIGRSLPSPRCAFLSPISRSSSPARRCCKRQARAEGC